ncbi:MAG: DUF177 domain-containing protein [Dysgonamonadaceae bacterium]|jgi:uncharacterized metal-binding protein YceD (DUF177 family)|nr:DUF177 domain-containing protein [Dysgonamonadaceae bacterium]
MSKFSLYKISLKNLSQGVHTYEYELDRKFFEAIDGDEVKKGNVKVTVTVKKTSSTFEFDFTLKGVVQVPCSRCLDDMNQEIDSHNRLIVKFGTEYSEESDEIIIVPEDEGEINIAWFLYEFIVLNIPIKHTHASGECNKTMSSKLRKHRAVSTDDDSMEDEEVADDDFSDDNNSSVSDPRWDTLKELNFDDN